MRFGVFRTLLPADFIVPTADVAVAWSGGADSTALLLALRAAGCKLTAWHVDHAWHPSSGANAARLEAWAKGWGIPFVCTRLGDPPEKNREAKAREQRYEQFRQWGREQHIRLLFLAHHRRDQAETVCMRLLQGAGAAGCAAMKSRVSYGELLLLRPLLTRDPEELRCLLRQHGVPWLEDPTNRDLSLRRNMVRHRLFPAMQACGTEPVDLFLRWQKQAEQLLARVDQLVPDVEQIDEQHVRVKWTRWCHLSPAVRARLLQNMVQQVLGPGTTPGRRHILLAEAWTRRGGRGGLDLSGCRLQRQRRNLHLFA